MDTPLLEVSGLRKSYAGVPALRNGQFRLAAGSVHALCGGNGAGKSTFLSIVMGIQPRDAGSIRRRGAEVQFDGPAAIIQHNFEHKQPARRIPAPSLPSRIVTPFSSSGLLYGWPIGYGLGFGRWGF